MKLIASALIAVLGASVLVGCEASAKVGDPDHVDTTSSDTHTTYKKTTIERPTGETTVHTEKKTTTY